MKFIGLGPGSSSQHSMCWLRHMPVHWTRQCTSGGGKAATPPPPPAGEGGPPEAPPESPAGGALPEARIYAFGFTRARKNGGFGQVSTETCW